MNKAKQGHGESFQEATGRQGSANGLVAERRIGMILSSKEQIPLAQDFATDYCNKLHLGDKFKFDLHLIIEEFLTTLFDNVGSGREVPFYFTHREKGIRLVFDISGTGFRPVFASFSPLEFERDKETESLMALTVLEGIVDNIKHIRQADKDEIHFLMYIGDEDFKDVY